MPRVVLITQSLVMLPLCENHYCLVVCNFERIYLDKWINFSASHINPNVKYTYIHH